jgi:hypothetical protein
MEDNDLKGWKENYCDYSCEWVSIAQDLSTTFIYNFDY